MEFRLRALVFDWGGILVSHRSETADYARLKTQTLRDVYRGLQKSNGLTTDFHSFSSAYDATSHRLFMRAVQHNEPMSEMNPLRSITEQHGLTINNAECREAALLISRSQSSLFVLFDDVASTLKQLHVKGIPMGLISNTPWLAEAHDAELKRHSLNHYFAFRLYSSEERTWKPHRPIFQRAAEALGLLPHQIAYVGDRVLDDVQGAQNAGMIGILIDRSGSFNKGDQNVAPDWIFSDLHPLINLPFTTT